MDAMGRLARIAIALPLLGGPALVTGGCYQPALDACRYACAANGACPDGLACNAQGMCAASATATCSPVQDGAGDASIDSACGWPRISNVDPCAVNADMSVMPMTVVAGDRLVIDTNALSASRPLPTDAQLITYVAGPAPEVVLLILGDLTMRGALTVTGQRPLIILSSGTVTIDGAADVVPSSMMPACPGVGGPGGGLADENDTAGTGGGGGGSYGSRGGTGGRGGPGSGIPGVGGTGGAMFSGFSPLQPGCGGGGGGFGLGGTPATPGAGGGALQIAAKQQILINGTITAPGGGGSPAANPQNAGGGGGAGGTILLESAVVALGGSARLCANGGGGASNVASAGAAGGCDMPPAPAPGGTGPSRGGVGAVAGMTAGDGMMGSISGGMGNGGGGAGGGVGRIGVRGTLQGGVASSPPYEQLP